MTPRRLLVLLQRLPQDGHSQVAQALLGEAAAWTLHDRLLAHTANLLHAANAQRAGKRVQKNELIKPPEIAPTVPTRTSRPASAATPRTESVGTWRDLDKLFTGED